MSLTARVLSIFRRISIVIGIAVAFLFGVGTTVYLSLRSPEVKVPNVVGKDRFEAEKILAAADLNFRVRAVRPSNQANPDTVLFQLPRADEVVKAGQTVAMDISRAAKEGETPETVKPEEPAANSNSSSSSNENENKPKRNRNTNKNANDNANANGNSNRPANVNRPANANRSNVNTDVDSTTTPHSNVNRTATPNGNSRPVNQNENRRPAPPKPTPGVSNSNRQNH